MDPIKTDILKRAEETIHGERTKTYGPATESFKQVAQVASMLTGKELSASDVLLVMTSAKLVRNRYSPQNDDHRLDACGYLGILDEVIKDEAFRNKQSPKHSTFDELLYNLAKLITARVPLQHNEVTARLRASLSAMGVDYSG